MGIRFGRSRIVISAGVFGLAAVGFLWSRSGSLPRATAAPPPAPPQQAQPAPVTTAHHETSDYSKRVVAYVYDTVPLTREELGEYLIARFGKDRVNNFVNRRIIEMAAKERGIEVTDAEVDADLTETLKSLNTTRSDFVSKLLKPYGKNMYEWKEDVIKPRILLAKLCRDRVVVTEDDMKKAYEAKYGEKIECRLILWPRDQRSVALAMYTKIRDSEAEFERAAKQQADPKLAGTGGRIEPFGRHTTGNEQLEKSAFRLKPGEMSEVLETPQGFLVIKCIKLIPPEADKKYDAVKDSFREDIVKRKIAQQEVPKYFKELKDKANPKIFLKDGPSDEEMIREVSHEIQEHLDKKNGTGAAK